MVDGARAGGQLRPRRMVLGQIGTGPQARIPNQEERLTFNT
jgi:hypothetical protein